MCICVCTQCVTVYMCSCMYIRRTLYTVQCTVKRPVRICVCICRYAYVCVCV